VETGKSPASRAALILISEVRQLTKPRRSKSDRENEDSCLKFYTVIPGRHEVANPESRNIRMHIWIPDRRYCAVRNDKKKISP
jgi:hypothetical protein